MKLTLFKKCLTVFAIIISGSSSLNAQINLVDTVREEDASARSANSGFAEDEFRRGVECYYRGAYNDAIREFEKALSYLPGENMILDWLGKAYYKAGLEGSALGEWNYAAENGYGGILLSNKIEIVSERRIVDSEYSYNQHFTESGSFPYANGKSLIYSQPISCLANDDGSIWIAAYGSNELVRFDVNGVVTRRSRGPLNGFDRPSDIIKLQNGDLLVCESAGDRLALCDRNGVFKRYIGSQGIYEGQLIGPQYMAEDSYGNIYVTDFGNSRVVVFDQDGNSLLSFGRNDGIFQGFSSPTGIAVKDDRIFVADSVYGAIYEFDRSGNYIGNLTTEHAIARPECMKNWGDFLVLTDRNKIITVDTSTGSVFTNATTGNGKSELTSAVPDKNGNLITTDFKANEIYIMSKMPELVGGFFVQIERVISDEFPKVILEVSVENRRREQIVGLNESNFFVTENKRSVADFKYLGSANNNDICDITFILDKNLRMENYIEEINDAVREICQAMGNQGQVQIISAGEIPVIEYTGGPGNLFDFDIRSTKNNFAQNSRMDLAIRLAANNLINGEKKRAIILVTDGYTGQNSFESYTLSDISAYLNNNKISLSCLMVNQGNPQEEISYLTEYTSGNTYYVYRNEGLSPVLQDILEIPVGLYQLSYNSALPIEYGRKYLPVEVEVYLLNRSGRDETGYFAPLQ